MRNNSIKIDYSNMQIDPGAVIHNAGGLSQALQNRRTENAWRSLPFDQKEIAEDIAAEDIPGRFDAFVVLGIGGSALGSKAMFSALKHPLHNELCAERRGCPRFYVADNVDPDGLSALFDVLDPHTTCFHIITKSGNTVETASQMMLALDFLKKELGNDFKSHVYFTTDKQKGNLRRIADAEGIKTYIVPDGVGGRFSVLSPVGLLSAAALRLDTDAMLRGAADMDAICSNPDISENPAFMYALMFTEYMKRGVNISVMMPYAGGLLNTAEWYAQLWAESLGKKYDRKGNVVHCGQTPVRALGVTDQHSQIQLYAEGPADKIITFIEVADFNNTLVIPQPPIDVYDASYLAGQSFNKLIASELRATELAVTKAGRPNMRITLSRLDEYNLGALWYFLEMATAAAGELLGIDAFDQPGVEEGKISTFSLMGRPGYEDRAAELCAVRAQDDRLIFSY